MEPTNTHPTATADSQSFTSGDPTPFYSPSGRFGRLSYIAWATLISVVGQLIMVVAMMLIGGGAAMSLSEGMTDQAPMPEIGGAVLAVYLVVGLVALVLTIIFAVRRCHDMDISGWWNLLILVPIVNLIYGLFLVLKPGTAGPNRFGPARPTPVWEKVVGIIGVILIVVAVVGVIVAVVIPLITGMPDMTIQPDM